MMASRKNKLTLALVFAIGIAVPGSAFATNGYFSHGYSIKEKGLAGAGVAHSQDSLAAATNPAGMVMVGSRLDVGASLFNPNRSVTVTGMPSAFPGTFPLEPGTVESDSDYFLIPHFGYNKMLNADSAVGISVYGNGGMNTDYPDHANPVRVGSGMCPSGTFCAGNTGVDLAQLFFNASYAQKINPSSAWGASVIFAYQQFEAEGLGPFGMFSTDPTNVTNNGKETSTGFGIKLGIQGEVASGVTLGASYQSEIDMGELDKYKGLFAEQGDFDIPSTATIGLAFETSATSTIVLDVQKIWYSDIKAISNPMSHLVSTTDSCSTGNLAKCLGGSDGVGFGWEDMTIVKVGFEWESSPDMTWRIGYSQGDQPIPDSEVLFNILAPAVVETHITFGFTKEVGQNSEWSFAAMYAPEEKVSGANLLEAPGQQEVEIKMDQLELALSWAKKF